MCLFIGQLMLSSCYSLVLCRFNMGSKTSGLKNITKIWANQDFLMLLIFNLLSNATAVVTFEDVGSILMILCISALSATIESCICRLFKNRKIHNIVLSCFIAAHLFTAIIDSFLIVNFNLIFTQNAVGIIAETTPEETKSFLSTYLTFWNILLIIGAVFATIWIISWLARKMVNNKPIAVTSMVLSILGASVYLFMVYKHATTGGGDLSVSQLHSFSRYGYSLVIFKNAHEDIKTLREINRAVVAERQEQDAPTVVVVIGESFSIYHSSLYGYPKQTNPLLSERVSDGSMVVFDNVVSISDHTGVVMYSVYVANGSSAPSSGNVLFPVCFRKAGYKTALLDNQYFVGNGLTWINDEKLSDIMFDYRNKESVGLDNNLIKELPTVSEPQLVVIHLMGQHYTYEIRYPSEFKRFSASDYSGDLTDAEREIVAHYDNATLYNDYVVDNVIKKFEDKNCIIVYFSDHGEEIYEIDDFMGHGNAAQRPTLKYQMTVPLMVWTSKAYQTLHPDVVQRLKDAEHKPIFTDNIPHFLFDVAGIKTEYFAPELSFVNDNYKPATRRVLGSIDYDKYKEESTVKARY